MIRIGSYVRMEGTGLRYHGVVIGVTCDQYLIVYERNTYDILEDNFSKWVDKSQNERPL